MNIKQKIKKSTLFNKLIYSLNKRSFSRNVQFKDMHKGDTCYIFGNGESIKSMDLNNFNDKISIGCNNLFLHKDFEKLDCRYYQIVAPLIFLPYFKYYGKLQKNDIASVYRKKIKSLKKTLFFTSIFNKYSLVANNIYYEHHFDKPGPDIKNCDLAGSFSFMNGATDAMIGMAVYMGFKKAILVGVDYTFADNNSMHFFEKGRGTEKNEEKYNVIFLNQIKENIDLVTITTNDYKSDTLEHVSYFDYTGKSEIYQENVDIILASDLEKLDKMRLYKIS